MKRLFAGLLAIGALWPGAAFAQAAGPEPERCPKLIAEAPPFLLRASFVERVATEKGKIRLTFIGHSTFEIESPGGITIATDYNDLVRPADPPLIATMNRAHTTHYTNFPDPRIKYVLKGWGENGEPAKHELAIGDVWLRNVTTNIRYGFDVMRDANSIFVFEVAGLCIAHLGHLHHKLTPEHLAQLGRIDVVLAPVDGGYTLNVAEMVETLQEMQTALIIPMHYFSPPTLQRFIANLSSHYEVTFSDRPTVMLSRETLPRKPTILVLPGD